MNSPKKPRTKREYSLSVQRPTLDYFQTFIQSKYNREYDKIIERLAKIKEYHQVLMEDIQKIEEYRIRTTRTRIEEPVEYRQYLNSGQNF
jgi:hypothetical protein